MRTCPLLCSLAIFLAAGVPLAAQTFPTQDRTIRDIYEEGMHNSQLQAEAHALFDSLGPRLMGTPNLKRAQDWLVGLYSSLGIDAQEEEYGTWRGWERGHSYIDTGVDRTIDEQIERVELGETEPDLLDK